MEFVIDTSELKSFADRLENASEGAKSSFFNAVLNRVGMEAFDEVKSRTPKVEGTLKKTWGISEVRHKGSSYSVEISNNTSYAMYVEEGHPTSRAGVARWVPGYWESDHFVYDPNSKDGMLLKPQIIEGKHMLRDGIATIEAQIEPYIAAQLKAFFGG